MNEQGISAFCLGNGALKCDGCLQERNWQTLNQLPDALRLAIQKTAIRIDDTDCILAGRPFYIGPQPRKPLGLEMKIDEIGDPPKLKPCPFCGKDLAIRWRRINPKASCQTPECWGAKLPVLQLDVPEFVAAWNTRADTI